MSAAATLMQLTASTACTTTATPLKRQHNSYHPATSPALQPQHLPTPPPAQASIPVISRFHAPGTTFLEPSSKQNNKPAKTLLCSSQLLDQQHAVKRHVGLSVLCLLRMAQSPLLERSSCRTGANHCPSMPSGPPCRQYISHPLLAHHLSVSMQDHVCSARLWRQNFSLAESRL